MQTSSFIRPALALLLCAAWSSLMAEPYMDSRHGGSIDVLLAVPGDPLDPQLEQDPGIADAPPNVGWANVLGYELRGRTGPYQYGTSELTGAQWCTGTERFADSRIAIPHNAQIQFFRMWGFDSSADHDVTAFLFQSCLPDLGSGSPINTVIMEISSSGTPGTFTVTSAPNFGPTDLATCTYHVRVRFGADCAGGGQTTVRKLRVQYSLL